MLGSGLLFAKGLQSVAYCTNRVKQNPTFKYDMDRKLPTLNIWKRNYILSIHVGVITYPGSYLPLIKAALRAPF